MASPVRTCIGCGACREKGKLVRLVSVQGRGEVDCAGSAPGRGTYVCDVTCARKAVSRRAFARTFRARVEVDADALLAAGER